MGMGWKDVAGITLNPVGYAANVGLKKGFDTAMGFGGKPPASPNYNAVAESQRAYNNPDQNTPYASQTRRQSDVGPMPTYDGGSIHSYLNDFNAWQTAKANAPWEQNTEFDPQMGGINDALKNQAANTYGQAMDWSQFGSLNDGSQAREQAINAAYGEATKRLDPQWDRRAEAQRTQLLNMGLDPNSEAARSADQDLNFARNDAYTSAMNSAIGQGQAAGDAVFRNDLLRRQQMVSEALRARGMPMAEMQGMQQFLSMPGVNQDNSALTAAIAQGNYDQGNYQAQQQAQADMWNNLVQTGQVGANIYGKKAGTPQAQPPQVKSYSL